MTLKKMAIFVLAVALGLVLIPVVSPIMLVSILMYKYALKTARVTLVKGTKVYETSGLSDKVLHWSMKLSACGVKGLDMSVSPAIAIARYNYIVVRADLFAQYSALTQQFIFIHETGHLLDPQARKFFAGLNIEGEYRADAHAVKVMGLTKTQLREIYDELITNVSSGMKPKEAKVIEDVMYNRLVRAIEVSEQYMPATATLTATRR